MNVTDSNYDVISDDIKNSFDNMPGGVLIIADIKRKHIVYANNSAVRIFECEDNRDYFFAQDVSFMNHIHKDDVRLVANEIKRQVGSKMIGTFHINHRIVTGKDHVRYVETYGNIVENEKYERLIYVFVADYQTRPVSYDIDKITGLEGMRGFLADSTRLLNENTMFDNPLKYVFLHFNIINFKLLNIKYGIDVGDEILAEIANKLKMCFEGDLISRFSDDHFVVLTKADDIEHRIITALDGFHSIKKGMGVEGKVGIYRINNNEEINPAVACDMAKVACDSIRKSSDRLFAYFVPNLTDKLEISEYVVEHIDEAVQNEYIKVYYQPVVRTISGAVCGMEALARWDDPKMGFLSPAFFITALEDSRKIYKLDIYMAQAICKNYRERVDNNEVVVPVSFNISRMDFFTCDIFSEIEKVVEKYQVPRNMIHIEITESIFMHDAIEINHKIEKFHDKGYQVWMDDFGSGYSSLNVLKDYRFDEIKIDMEFLASFSDRSKNIITSTVDMAKKIGIQTLAEGVETKEQFEYLKNIGCEKVQGYYFGKPAPYDEAIRHCKEKGLKIEGGMWRNYYDTVGRVDFMTDIPLAVFEDDGKTFHFLFANDAYKAVLESIGNPSLEVAEYNINSPLSPMAGIFRGFVQKPIKSGKEEVITYPSKNQYVRLAVRTIAQCNDRYIHLASITNVTRNVDKQSQENLDKMIRNIYLLYDDIRHVDLENDCLVNVIDGAHAKILYDVEATNIEFCNKRIHPDDRDKYIGFTEYKALKERIIKSNVGYISDYFRTIDKSGKYVWKVHTLLMLPKTHESQFIHCIKTASFCNEDVAVSLMKRLNKERGYD